MRLTLRTLLAYLDDCLSPSDTKLIGQKIQESQMAQLLVSRIREVMRRRRLKSPEVFGPEMGIDPNIVAQYLDSSLPPERYADVERVLLASDEMLAEVSACHQVLTLALANPVEVIPSSRERLYALGPVEKTSQLKLPVEAEFLPKHQTDVVANRSEPITARNGSGSTFERSLNSRPVEDERIMAVPDYLKSSPWTHQFFPSALVALLVLVCIGLLSPGFMTGIQKAKTEIDRKVARQKGDTSNSERVDSASDESETVAMTDSTKQSHVENLQKPEAFGSTPLKIPEGIDPLPPDDVADEVVSKVKPMPAETDVATTPLPVKTTKEKPPAEQPMVPAPAPAVAEAPASPTTTYTSIDGVLVRLDEGQRHWFIVPHRSNVKSGEIIANLEPFDGVLHFEKIDVRATLIGETVVKLLVPAEAGTSGLGIGRGRILIQSIRPGENQTTSIGFAIGEDVWNLELLSSETVCGLEVAVREPTQFQKLNDYHWYQATLYVISGKARWSNREGKTIELGDHMALNIIPEKAATVRTVPISFPSPPDWFDSVKRKSHPLRRYQAPFEKTFEVDQPVDQTILTVVKNSKNPKIAELAARCLAAIDNYVGLVETLAECPHEEARFAARDGLRQWLPMNPDGSNGLRLKAELENHYPQPDADAAYRMLWGFSREDVKDSKATSWQFTTWMRSQRLEIREMADYWVERLTGRKTEYRASDFREAHVRRIEEQIERDNGLIKGP